MKEKRMPGMENATGWVMESKEEIILLQISCNALCV